MALEMHPSIALHVGEWLRTEIIAAHGLKMGDAAGHLGVTRQTLSRLVNCRQDLTADMAIRFEKVFGVKADTLMRMQVNYNLAQARAHEDDIEVTPLKLAA